MTKTLDNSLQELLNKIKDESLEMQEISTQNSILKDTKKTIDISLRKISNEKKQRLESIRNLMNKINNQLYKYHEQDRNDVILKGYSALGEKIELYLKKA